MSPYTVKASGIQHVDVLLTPWEERRIAVQFLSRLFKLPEHPHIYKGKVCHMVEQGGHNNDIEREVWEANATPTPLTEAAITVLEHIRKLDRS